VSQRRFVALGSMAIIAAALFVYRGQLGLYFTDVDTFPLISTSRIHSFGDLVSVITSPLMGGLMTNALFYRPISSLTWGIDELIWGLDPLGYHISGLAIHIANSLVLYLLLSRLARWREDPTISAYPVSRGQAEALVAALLFAIHPITMETVPAIARRPDLLMCFFLLLTLMSMLAYLRELRFVYLVVAGFFCVCGLLSKDSGVIISAIAVTFVFCFVDAPNLLARIKACIRPAWPLLLAVLFFIGLRAMVLKGFGGYAGNFDYTMSAVVKSSLTKFMCVIGMPGDLDSCTTDNSVGLAGVLLLLALASAIRLRLERDDFATRRVAFALLSLGLYFAMYMATFTAALTRTMYSLIPFVCILLAWAIVGTARAAAAVTQRKRGEAPSQEHGGTHMLLPVSRWLSGGIAALILLSILRTAWSGLYIENWRTAGEIGRRTLATAESAMADVPKGSVVYLVDFPYRMGSYWFRERPIFLEFSVQGWADMVFPEKDLRVIALSFVAFPHEEPEQLASSIRYDPIQARLDISVGQDAVVDRFAPNDEYLEQIPLRQARYSKKPDGSGIFIDLDREAFEGQSVTFLVFRGEEVVLRGLEPWSEVHPPGTQGI
jgi:hypothetical protein